MLPRNYYSSTPDIMTERQIAQHEMPKLEAQLKRKQHQIRVLREAADDLEGEARILAVRIANYKETLGIREES